MAEVVANHNRPLMLKTVLANHSKAHMAKVRITVKLAFQLLQVRVVIVNLANHSSRQGGHILANHIVKEPRLYQTCPRGLANQKNRQKNLHPAATNRRSQQKRKQTLKLKQLTLPVKPK